MDLSRPTLGSSVMMRRQVGTARPVELLRRRGAGMPPRDDPDRLNHPYRTGFSGRDVCKTSNGKHVSHHRSTDSNWVLRGPFPDKGLLEEINVVYLVEMMINAGWDTIKEWEIQEESMPTAKKIMDLFGEDGQPLDLSDSPEDVRLLVGNCHLGTYPAWTVSQTGPNDFRQGDEPDMRRVPVQDRLFVYNIAQLQWWANTGVKVAGGHMGPITVQRPFGVEIVAGAYKNAGRLRSIRNVGDPVGLVADKLGRAIANERREGGEATGDPLEPVFVHVYSQAHDAVLHQFAKDGKLSPEFKGCAAFHVGVECFGVEWSYGYSDADASGEEEGSGTSGLFPSPPKCCAPHTYRETHYLGDTVLSADEFECCEFSNGRLGL